jgi:hypothetical protein
VERRQRGPQAVVRRAIVRVADHELRAVQRGLRRKKALGGGFASARESRNGGRV